MTSNRDNSLNESSQEFLNVDAEGKDGTGPAVAAVLESVAETLRDAPEDYRYDFDLTVEEDANA